MAETHVPFYTQAAVLEQLAADTSVLNDQETVLVVLNSLKENADLRRHFFRSRPVPAWVPALREYGFLDAPPSPVETDEGLMLQSWEAQDYLASVASKVPEEVVRHILSLTAHPHYVRRAMSCLSNVPVEAVFETMPRLIEWLEDRTTAEMIATAAWDVAKRLADEAPERSFQLVETLLRPLANPRVQRLGRFAFGAEAVPLSGQPHLEAEWFRPLRSHLTDMNAKLLASMLESHLASAVRIESEVSESYFPHESSWRSAIEQSAQNHPGSYKDDLLDWLRDTCETLMRCATTQAGREMLTRYLGSDAIVLRRLGIHLLRQNADRFLDLVDVALMSPPNYSDSSVHHEFLQLLQAGYPMLDELSKTRVLGIILAGPAQSSIEPAEYDTSEQLRTNAEDDRSSRTDYWKLQRLWMLREHIAGNAAAELVRLVSERGEPKHPDFLVWRSSGGFVRQKSPQSVDQLSSYAPEELLTFLNAWEPAPNFYEGLEEVSREGLGSSLAKVLLANLERYEAYLADICSIHPTYCFSLLRYASGRVTGDGISSVELGPLVNLCTVLLGDGKGALATDTRWRDVRRAIVWLMERAMVGENATDHIPAIQQILLTLIDDPDPDIVADRPDERWVGHEDPSTVALNHVRPAALAALITSAILTAEPSDGGPSHGRMNVAVRTALTRKLDDWSLAVRSVYGRNLMALHWLDSEWLDSHLEAIFPPNASEEGRLLYSAAWDAYVTSDRLYPDLLDRLQPLYRRAIDNVADGYVSKSHLRLVTCLAGHLVLDYLDDASGRQHDGTLLELLFEKADSDDRGQMAWVVWRQLNDKKEAGQDVGKHWTAARALWQRCIDRAASENYPSDYDNEIAWFSQLLEFAPHTETLENLFPLLQSTLHYAADYSRRSDTWEHLELYLGRTVHAEPDRVIEFYALMFERSSGPMWRRDEGVPHGILSTCASRNSTRQRTLDLIDSLGRKGDLRFRDIYEQYA